MRPWEWEATLDPALLGLLVPIADAIGTARAQSPPRSLAGQTLQLRCTASKGASRCCYRQAGGSTTGASSGTDGGGQGRPAGRRPALTVIRRLLRTARLDVGEAGARAPIVIAGAAALFAAGLSPVVFGPALTSLEVAARLRPELEFFFLLSVLVSGSMYLVGGLFADAFGRRRVLLVGLAALAIANAATMLTNASPQFSVMRAIAAAAVGLVIPGAIAAVAVPFKGETRAVTIGIGFTALGFGGAVGVVLVAAFANALGYWPALVAAVTMAALAFQRVHSDLPRDERHEPVKISAIGVHVLWAFGLLAVATSIIGLGGRVEPLRVTVGVVGVVSVLFALRRLQSVRERTVELRPVAFALIAGVALAFAQSAPLLVLPKYLRYVEGLGPVVSVLGVAPLFLGFLLAGPLTGPASARFSPRVVIAASLVVLGLANLAVALAVVGSLTAVVVAAVPLLAIGTGFIVGTSVRTAVIFSSVSRRLPSTAAALNQTSILIGSQLGVMVLTTVIGATALSTYRTNLDGLGEAEAAARAQEFERLLRAIDTPDFAPMAAHLDLDAIERYASAFTAGVATGLVTAGLLALTVAAVTWLGMRGDAPLSSRYDYLEERSTP